MGVKPKLIRRINELIKGGEGDLEGCICLVCDVMVHIKNHPEEIHRYQEPLERLHVYGIRNYCQGDKGTFDEYVQVEMLGRNDP
jgi:hypothetical protein